MSDLKRLAEAVLTFCNATEAATIELRKSIEQLTIEAKPLSGPAVVNELTFSCLTFEPQQGVKIGSYEVAYKATNIADKWDHALNILRQNNSTINSRYHGESYVFSYWLYGEDKIYRQKLKPS